MLNCRICGCYCDPSDLVNYVCDDCRDKDRKTAEEAARLAGLVNSREFSQIKINLEGDSNEGDSNKKDCL